MCQNKTENPSKDALEKDENCSNGKFCKMDRLTWVTRLTWETRCENCQMWEIANLISARDANASENHEGWLVGVQDEDTWDPSHPFRTSPSFHKIMLSSSSWSKYPKLPGYKGFKVTQGYIHPNNLPYLAISWAHCSPKFTKRSQVFSALILAASFLRTTTHIHATPVHIQNQAAKSQSAEYQIRESICVSTYLNILKATPRPGHSSLTQSD